MCDRIQANMYDALKRAFPKALRECEMYQVALSGIPATQHPSKIGGRYMSDLCKKGMARKIATGYYVAVTPFQQPAQALSEAKTKKAA